jgi:ketosteroid isomerase-like protein
MSRENVDGVREAALVERVQAGYDAWDRGDIDALLAELDADIEWVEPPDAPDGGVHRGRDAVRAVLDESLATWSLRFEVQRVVPWADGLVVLLSSHATGHGSGVSLDGEAGHVITVRDGKIVRVRQFGRHSEALEAAGLSE